MKTNHPQTAEKACPQYPSHLEYLPAGQRADRPLSGGRVRQSEVGDQWFRPKIQKTASQRADSSYHAGLEMCYVLALLLSAGD